MCLSRRQPTACNHCDRRPSQPLSFSSYLRFIVSSRALSIFGSAHVACPPLFEDVPPTLSGGVTSFICRGIWRLLHIHLRLCVALPGAVDVWRNFSITTVPSSPNEACLFSMKHTSSAQVLFRLHHEVRNVSPQRISASLRIKATSAQGYIPPCTCLLTNRGEGKDTPPC